MMMMMMMMVVVTMLMIMAMISKPPSTVVTTVTALRTSTASSSSSSSCLTSPFTRVPMTIDRVVGIHNHDSTQESVEMIVGLFRVVQCQVDLRNVIHDDQSNM